MSKVLIFGASSGVSRALAAQLKYQQIPVVVFGRQAADGIESCDALDSTSVNAAFERHLDATAVVSVIGGRPFQKTNQTPPDLIGNEHLIRAAEARGVRRFVLVSTIGAGNSRKAAPWIAKLVLGRFMKLKTAAEELLQASSLNWTIIRPGHLKDGAASGRAILTEDHMVSGAVQRADVAVKVAEVLDTRDTFGRIYSCIDRG